MQPTTLAGLVFALLAMLVLLLGSIVSRRRRERAEARPGEVRHDEEPQVPAVEAVDPEVAEVAEVEPEPEPEPAVGVPEDEAPAKPRKPRKRRFRRAKVVEDAGVVDAEPTTADHPIDESPEQAEVRALREQLRALEQVVQQQTGEHPTAALSRVEDSAAEQSKTYLRQVSLVVRGLADHTDEDENPHRTLARVAAAVERLGVPNAMERPVLPLPDEPSARPRSDGLRSPSHRRELPELEAGSVMPAMSTTTIEDVFSGLDGAVPDQAPQEDPAPYAAPASEADPVDEVTETRALDQVEAAAPEADLGIPAFEEPELVLPVPPPANSAPATGRRRRRSKSV
ncbi:hypothetical protein [Nocardioides ungokensis]|uniref:hypothetical protein n=1 Tax=Nocardioides ungokensis TaxID=1643322 RepID=UPI0015DFF8A5|nr:hypothetical protein [Nocardioides ungokensis]